MDYSILEKKEKEKRKNKKNLYKNTIYMIMYLNVYINYLSYINCKFVMKFDCPNNLLKRMRNLNN